MLPLAADENVHGDIIRGLRRRQPNVDFVRVQDVGLDHAPDPLILEWAATEGRILVTQDVNTMVGFAWDRVKAGLPMPGVVVRGEGVTLRQAIDDLEEVVCCGAAEDFKDLVHFLPL
jgi:predicted nuclease of predicted toxin-antitoxin system